MRSSRLLGTTGPVKCPSTALLRIEFTAPFRLRTMGELLPRLSTLTVINTAVYLCCTCPEVTLGGRYPLSLPYGARTFLTQRLSPSACGCSACSHGALYAHGARFVNTLVPHCFGERMRKGSKAAQIGPKGLFRSARKGVLDFSRKKLYTESVCRVKSRQQLLS